MSVRRRRGKRQSGMALWKRRLPVVGKVKASSWGVKLGRTTDLIGRHGGVGMGGHEEEVRCDNTVQSD